MRKIRIAIVGVGNCASSLVQGMNFYDGSSRNGAGVGLMHRQIGGNPPGGNGGGGGVATDGGAGRACASGAAFFAPQLTTRCSVKKKNSPPNMKNRCTFRGC